MNAYDRIYLDDAVHNFGVMVDCAVNTLGCPAGQFWERFLASSIAGRFSRGAVDIIAGHSGVELALMVFDETGKEVNKCDTSVSVSSKEYWAGITLAHYQWSSALSFKELSLRGLDLKRTISMFNPLHEADQTVFDRIADDIVGKGRADASWIKEARRLNGITQEELSAKSGVPIRLIRSYEQGQINPANAEYDTVSRLKAALNVS